MRKIFLLIFTVFIMLIAGCDQPTDEVSYTRDSNGMVLKITHRVNGNSCTVTMRNSEEAKLYRQRLERLLKEIETYEKELSIKEKSN